MLAFLADWLTAALTFSGYLGLFIITTLENFIVPIPSEIVLPFTGYLVFQGSLSFWIALVVSTLGALVGSLASYGLGAWGGMPFVRRYGHWFLLSPKDLDRAHAWFERRGSVVVFLCRFFPGVRQVSSIPAGAARMHLGKFLFWTALGSALWNGALLWIGWRLGAQWQTVAQYTRYLDIVVVLVMLAGIAYWWHKHGRELHAEWKKARVRRSR